MIDLQYITFIFFVNFEVMLPTFRKLNAHYWALMRLNSYTLANPRSPVINERER
jgi:hypothetical protein